MARDGNVLFVDKAEVSPLLNPTLDEQLGIDHLRTVMCADRRHHRRGAGGGAGVQQDGGESVFTDEDARTVIGRAAMAQAWLIQDVPQVQRLIRGYQTRDRQRRRITKAVRQIFESLDLPR